MSWFDSSLWQLYHPRAMGQRPALLLFPLPLIALATFCSALAPLLLGCDRRAPAPATAVTPTTRPHTVASLSPAATEIILLALDAHDRLVAVSNFDPPREQTQGLPRVGDYQTTDWERLAALRPTVMITQFAPDRLPRGLRDRAAGLNIQLVNVPITRLDDIFAAIVTLGDAIDLHERGIAARDKLRQRLDALAVRSSGRSVRTLIVVDDAGRGVAGRNNYLDDLLPLVGGQNVMSRSSNPYPAIDPELLADLDPEVIFQLLPEASPQVLERARAMWSGMPHLQAVRNGRVHIITESYALRPTHQVADLAERFATALAECRAATSARPPSPATTRSVPIAKGSP